MIIIIIIIMVSISGILRGLDVPCLGLVCLAMA